MSALPDSLPTPTPRGPKRDHSDGAFEPSEKMGNGTINILIVDDEPANLVVLETVLDDPSYRLVKAHSAEDALHALVREEFALLVLDVRMPDMTGFELAQMIKARKKTARVPIIFLTAYYDKDQHALQGYETGAVDYLGKPVNPAVLRSKVAVFADLHRKNHEITLANRALLAEVGERRRVEEQLRNLNDTLERRVIERTEALSRADEKLQTIMSSITDGLLTLDRDWRFSYSNEQGARLLGMRREELLHGRVWELLPLMTGTAFEEGMRRAVETRQTVSFEALYPEPPGKWLRCHCYPSDEGLSVYFHDVTDRRVVEGRREQLLEAEQAARNEGERVARAKDEFLASLSHELRTPLAAMLGWAAVLKRPGTDPDTVRRGIDAIARNAQAQSHLVGDLLEMSRIVSGKLRMNLARVDLNAIASAGADTARPSAQSKAVTIEVQLADRPTVDLNADGARLGQVVANLLTNAIKFTPEGGTVTVATEVDDEHARLIVTDTGQGIAPEFLPYLFDRFSQADGSAARVHGGLGLGLSIVKHIVELHKGFITARSEGEGRGASFTVTFPRVADSDFQTSHLEQSAAVALRDASGELSASRPQAGLDLSGVSVLLVDDHLDVLEVESRLLVEYGAHVSTAASSDQALQLLQTDRFDALLSDLGMPGMDGYALIDHIRVRLGIDATQMPAAAVTAFVRPEDWDRALRAGYQACMHKPVSPDALARSVLHLVQARDKALRERQRCGPQTPNAVSDAHAESTDAGRVTAGHATQRLRALFVEDSSDLQELIGVMLEEEGLDLVICGNAEDAEIEFRRGVFDVVLTDVSLPGMSGVQFARRILVGAPLAWVVFSTGYPMGTALDEFGPNVRALVKPFEADALHALMDEVRFELRSR